MRQRGPMFRFDKRASIEVAHNINDCLKRGDDPTEADDDVVRLTSEDVLGEMSTENVRIHPTALRPDAVHESNDMPELIGCNPIFLPVYCLRGILQAARKRN